MKVISVNSTELLKIEGPRLIRSALRRSKETKLLKGPNNHGILANRQDKECAADCLHNNCDLLAYLPNKC